MSAHGVRRGLGVLALLVLGGWAQAQTNLVSGEGPGWRTLGEADFTHVNCASNTWTWREGVLHCTGQPVGVLRTTHVFTNLELVVEWRHLKPAGNSGVFLWTVPESVVGLPAGRLPRGIEIQILDHGYAEQYAKRTGKQGDWFTTHGDVFAVGVGLKPFPPLSPNGSRSFPKSERSRPSPEWNHYYVRAVNGEVRLSVNGEEVSGGSDANPAAGYLCLESEGSPIEFRTLRVRELP
jgi:hypothetical protein